MKLKLCLCIISLATYALTAKAETVRVIDGDSLEIGERQIRLDGIDAPEFTQICQTTDGKDYKCGIKALHYLEKLTKDKDVTCRCLPEKDHYKREICECFADDLSLNKALVEAGWAITYRDKTYLSSEESAKQSKRGIWQGKYMRPAIYRALHRTEPVKTKIEP